MGFSTQLLHGHAKRGNLERVMHGIYRIARFPPSPHEDLVVIWLWSAQEGVFSHETALSLHDLSDAPPAKIHVTLPLSASRRRQIPAGVVVHYGDIGAEERQWLGTLQVTTPARSICDVAKAHGDIEHVSAAIDQGIRRGLFSLVDVVAAAVVVAEGLGVT